MTVKAAGLLAWSKNKINAAGSGTVNVARAARSSLKEGAAGLAEAPPHSKIGLGLGITSLGLGVSNWNLNREKSEAEIKRQALEAKSLTALNKIHQAITSNSTESSSTKT